MLPRSYRVYKLCANSGAGTNLKVVGVGTRPARSAGNFFGRARRLFGHTSTTSRFGERFRDGQYSLVIFLFVVLLLTVPPCPAICKSGGTCSPCPMESAPLTNTKLSTHVRESGLPGTSRSRVKRPN